MPVLTHNGIESVWLTATGSQSTADMAAAIAQAESGGNTTRINNTAYPKLPGYQPPSHGALPEYSVGLWQINILAHPQYTVAYLLTPVGNANAAAAISRNGADWGQWTTFTKNLYEKYLQSGGTPTPTPGAVDFTSGSIVAPHAHGGWADLRQSITHHLPNQLRRSDEITARALKSLGHRSRVHGGKR